MHRFIALIATIMLASAGVSACAQEAERAQDHEAPPVVSEAEAVAPKTASDVTTPDDGTPSFDDLFAEVDAATDAHIAATDARIAATDERIAANRAEIAANWKAAADAAQSVIDTDKE